MAKRRRLVSEDFWRWSEANKQFVGTFIDQEALPYQDKTITQYNFKAEDGRAVKMNATDQLLRAMEAVQPNDEVEINYLGTQKTGGGFDVQLFQVWILEDDEDEPSD